MKRRALAELVDQYVDGLCAGVESVGPYLMVFPQFRGDLEPLFGLARRVKGTLVPVEPSPEFAHGLEMRLLAAWHQNRAREETRRRDWLIRAAAVGSLVSVAAVATVIARSRGQWVTVPEIKMR